MADGPSVLILDDGELGDVRAILEELEVDFEHLRGGVAPSRLDPPRRLLVTTARRAAIARGWPDPRSGGPVKLGVAGEDSNALRESLRRLGFDYLVRPPVHREALRLLLLRALYAGRERRREPRVFVGTPVSCRVGLRRRSATLIEIALHGARLLSSQPFAPGARLTLELPAELAGDTGAWLRAKVVRALERGAQREHVTALAFEGLKAGQERMLERMVARSSAGPLPALGGDDGDGDDGRAPAPADTARDAAADRRRQPRARFAGEVVTRQDPVRGAVLGRDISVEGMRIEPQPGLQPGQVLHLEIYAAAGEPPISVRARILRNDGPAGVALRFDELSHGASRRIEELVAQLPSVEPLQDGECAGLGSVVSRVLESDRARE